MSLASRMLAGAPISISDRPGETMWVFIQHAGPQIASLVDVFNLLSEAAKCYGSPVEMLSAFIGSESLARLLRLVQKNALQIASQPLRLLWSTTRISSHFEDFHAMLQATSAHCPGLLLQIAADLISPAHRAERRSSCAAQQLEARIATLLRAWCEGSAGAELRSVQRWIGAFIDAPVPKDPACSQVVLRLSRDCLKRLHACSRAAAGLADVAEWALNSALALGLEEARTWDALPMVAQGADVLPGDPVQNALARLKPASTQEAALCTQGLHAARQLADLLVASSGAAFIDLLTQQPEASDIVRVLGQGLVALQLPPPASCGDIVVTALDWRVLPPPPLFQPQFPAAILALARLLLSIDPQRESNTVKVVELLFAAMQATRDGKGRKRLRHGLIDSAGIWHHTQPAILQAAEWCPMLAKQLARKRMFGERRIVCEQLLLAWLQQWSRRSGGADPYPVVLALKQVCQAQPPRSQDSQDRLAACLQQLHIGARGSPIPAHARWADWALLALQQWTAPSAPALLQRCIEGYPQYAEAEALLDQLLPWWNGRDPRARLPAEWHLDVVLRPRLLKLSEVAFPPLRKRLLLLMGCRPFEVGAVPREHVLSLAQRLLNEACLLQHTLPPPAADIHMLVEAGFVHLHGCLALAPHSPARLDVPHTIVHDLAHLLAHPNASTDISAQGKNVCWTILLQYTEGALALEHGEVWSLLQPLVEPGELARAGPYPWIARKQAWQVLQTLEVQLFLDSKNENINVFKKKSNAELSKKAAELALALFKEVPDFARLRELADASQQHLQTRDGDANWPADLPVLQTLFRGKASWRGSVADMIVRFATQAVDPPEPDVGVAAALVLAEKAALDALGNGVRPDKLGDLALACMQLLKAEPLKKAAIPGGAKSPEPLEVDELICAITAVFGVAGSARHQWQSVRELLLRRWQNGEYKIAGAVLLDVVWPWLADGGELPAIRARRLVLIHAWNPPLRSRVIGILETFPDSHEARTALAECRDHERAIAREDKAQAARDQLANQVGLSFSLRPQPYDYKHATKWASLQMMGYLPRRDREALQELAELTTHREEYVRIQWFLSKTHPDLQAQAQGEAARSEWPAFWFGYDRWTTVTVTGTEAHMLIGHMLLALVVEELGLSSYAARREGDTWEFSAEEVDVRALRERLYDPQARIGDALTLASKVAAERKARKDMWRPGVSYEGVVECLVGCLLGSGMRMEAADLCKTLLDVGGLAVGDLVAHCAKAPAAQGTSALVARLMILDRVELAARLLKTDTDVAFEVLARELEWRDPDLGVKARLEWATRLRPDDRWKVLQACSPALPLSLDLSAWHASTSERFDPRLSLMADLLKRKKPIDDGLTWLPLQYLTRREQRAVLIELLCYPPKGLTFAEIKTVPPEAAHEFLRVAGSDSCDLPTDWRACIKSVTDHEGAEEALIPLLAAATFPGLIRLNEQEAPAAMGAMAAAMRRLLDHRYPQAARRLLDSVPARARGPDWRALDAWLRGLAFQPAETSELPPPRPVPSLQLWLDSSRVVRVDGLDPALSRRALQLLSVCLLRFGTQEHELHLSGTALETAAEAGEKIMLRAVQTLQAVIDLWLTLSQDDSAGALDLFELLLNMPENDGVDLLEDLACRRLALLSVACEDITGARARWTIGPGVRAFGSLGQLALWLLQRGQPAGFGLLHRLVRNQGPRREQLLLDVMRLYKDSRLFRESSRAGWAHFFALALRQPDLGEGIMTGLKKARVLILEGWHEWRYTIAAPVVVALLGARLVTGEGSVDETRLLQRLNAQADAAPVRSWIRQRALWFGIRGAFLRQEEDAWRSDHRQALEALLAGRGFALESLESWVAQDWSDCMLMMALADHLPDAEQAARLLLGNIKMLGERGQSAGPLAAVALRLPSASTELLGRLVCEWCKCWRTSDVQEIACAAVVLRHSLIAAGKVQDGADLAHKLESWLEKQSLASGVDGHSGELRKLA